MKYPNLEKSLLGWHHSYLYIFIFALAIRIFVIYLLPPQSWEYDTIATSIIKGNGFAYHHFGGAIYRSYCEPLYPFICAVVYFFTHHSIFVLEVVQAVLSSLICLIVYFCAENIFGHRIAFLSGILVALQPGLIIYTVKLHPLILDSLLISLVLLSMIRLIDNFSRGKIIQAGLIGGLCVLSRPTVLAFFPLALIYIFMLKKTSFSKGILCAAIFFASCGTVFLPWTVRNYIAQKEFMLTRSNTPYVFWLGNNPNFSGSAVDGEGSSLFEVSPPEFRKRVNSLDELGQNKEFLKDALNYIKKYPARFMQRVLKKNYYFWWFSPQAGLVYPKAWFLLYMIFYSVMLIFAIIGIFFASKQNRYKIKSALIIILLFSVSSVQSLFYIETRHRWAVEPLLLIFSAAGIYYLAAHKKEAR